MDDKTERTSCVKFYKSGIAVVNVSFGPLEGNMKGSLYTNPSELLHFVQEGYKEQRLEFDLTNMDFYHFSDSAKFDLIKALASPANRSLLFPGLRGTPYSVVIDREGQVRFRGHFTSGDMSYQEKYERHYGFISSLINDSCLVP